jgi:glycosyltransferase involved in cell wall biosynthesis
MKIETSPLVSVILPVFNGERYIEEAIESIYAQTYLNFEIIVVDDGSSDASASRLARFKDITYRRQDNQGPAIARNTGVRLAKGDCLAFLDQDDIWLPRKLEEQVSCLNANPNLGLLFCKQRIVVDEEAKELSPIVHEHLVKKRFREIVSLSPSAMMIRRELLEVLGGFNINYSFYSEADLMLRLKINNSPYHVVSQVLLLKRFHDNNLSYRTQVTQRELLGIFRDSIKRNSKYAYG